MTFYKSTILASITTNLKQQSMF